MTQGLQQTLNFEESPQQPQVALNVSPSTALSDVDELKCRWCA